MALKDSDGLLILNVFDEIMTPAARAKAERDRELAAQRAARSLRATASARGAGGGAARGGGTGDGDGGDSGGGAASGNAAAWDALTEGGRLPERERRFLGCLRVPLAAVYQAESLEGSFRVRLPCARATA